LWLPWLSYPLAVGRGTFPNSRGTFPKGRDTFPNGRDTFPKGRGTFPEPHSGHTGTISITICASWTRRNVMKPRIQCVLTQ
jgi:hypothetical protein